MKHVSRNGAQLHVSDFLEVIDKLSSFADNLNTLCNMRQSSLSLLKWMDVSSREAATATSSASSRREYRYMGFPLADGNLPPVDEEEDTSPEIEKPQEDIPEILIGSQKQQEQPSMQAPTIPFMAPGTPAPFTRSQLLAHGWPLDFVNQMPDSLCYREGDEPPQKKVKTGKFTTYLTYILIDQLILLHS